MYAEGNFILCWAFVRILYILYSLGTFSAFDVHMNNMAQKTEKR
jgi:hypothetical protein